MPCRQPTSECAAKDPTLLDNLYSEITSVISMPGEKFMRLVRNLCRDFEHNLATNLKKNPKAFWRYCKSKLKNVCRLGDLKSEAGDLLSDDREKADLLNQYFASVFTQEDVDNIPKLPQKYHGLDVPSTAFTI